MRGLRIAALRSLSLGFAVAVALSACEPGRSPANEPAPTSPGDELRAYLRDPAVARKALEDSIVAPENGYSRRRLREYRPERWGSLPTYDPPTAPILVDAPTGAAAPPPFPSAAWNALSPTSAVPTDTELLSLGERAFFAYPVQEARGLPEGLQAPDHAGVWATEGRFGAVWMQSSTGVRAAHTCATCHAAPGAAGLDIGRNNPDIEASRVASSEKTSPSWGRGRVDVTDDGLENPVVITDLRPIRWQKTLHRAATLRAGPGALAVRIETLIITSNGEAVRPPRIVAAALAMYLLSLGSPVPRSALSLNDEETRGAGVFETECARCHEGEGASGDSVRLAIVGTDPSVGESSDRGTGGYRIPSLRHVGDRRPLFATGSVPDLPTLLDPAREAVGHRFGLTVSEADRAALLAYLRRL